MHAVAHRAGLLRLLVVADNAVVATHVLPEEGSITIGRGQDNTIQIEDESISRRHAVLHVGRIVTIEDLGSSNGTKVRNVAVPPHQPRELGINELVTLGSLTLIIQARFSPAQTNRMATYDYFQARLEEECARASRSNTTFAVVAIRVDGDVSERAAIDVLMTTCRQSDVLAKRDDARAYELLLVDANHEDAQRLTRRLVESLRRIAVQVSSTIAQFPNDGRSAYALLTHLAGPNTDPEHDELVIAEQSMRDLYALARRIATSDLAVLVLGETGVGKEEMSRAVHRMSARAAQPFVAINCAALNDSLLESELFGHERGAFTGADMDKPGLLEAAAGGTIFLDEIGDMSLAIQAKLLRVFEEGEVRRVGGIKPRKIGARFVAATNTDLEAATARGEFREDLYFRLSAATLVIPPLRERPSEIEVLARRFATRAAARSGPRTIRIDADALAMLQGYSWPGNIRELRNVMERAVLLCTDDVIGVEHLPVERMRGTFLRQVMPTRESVRGTDAPANVTDERERIIAALESAGGNQVKAARLLGVSRRTLINRIEQYQLPRPRKGRRRRGSMYGA